MKYLISKDLKYQQHKFLSNKIDVAIRKLSARELAVTACTQRLVNVVCHAQSVAVPAQYSRRQKMPSRAKHAIVLVSARMVRLVGIVSNFFFIHFVLPDTFLLRSGYGSGQSPSSYFRCDTDKINNHYFNYNTMILDDPYQKSR